MRLTYGRSEIAFVLMIFALLVPLALAQTPSVAPQPTTVDGATTHAYKSIGQATLRMHVFNTHSSDARPAMVFFFGGGWTQGSVTQFAPQAKYLALRGMVAILADYRVFSRYGTSAFEAMTDAKGIVNLRQPRAQ